MLSHIAEYGTAFRLHPDVHASGMAPPPRGGGGGGGGGGGVHGTGNNMLMSSLHLMARECFGAVDEGSFQLR